ncbi:MAG: GspE/PulE family protein [Patescibacteria group bacterium]|nr:GspE/PulE family protein [Patescibacteria group bacterium]
MTDSEVQEETVNWQEVEIDNDVSSLLPIQSLEKYRFAPFEVGEEYIKVAIVDETDVNAQNALRFFAHKNKKKIQTFQIGEADFEVLIDKMRNPSVEIEKVLDDFEKTYEDEQANLTITRKKKQATQTILKDAPVAKMVEVIIKNAIDGKASDIHIEPMDKNVRVRYRVDGILYNSITLPKKIGPAIVSRVKILSNLKIDEKRKPQDGRFRIKDLGHSIDFRVSSLPTSYGEKVVMRILDTRAGLIDLEQLGVEGRDLRILKETVKEPHGIILVTGPTGSGKSTSLYSVLRILNKEGVNIVTLEDPVEYVLEGVNQSQVKPEIEYTFSSGLRSILRQDPDIIMVGEIRDEETAELAIHAALTGHLVLSTLHTNSAVGAVARLTDMGIQPFLLSSSLKLLIGQRLVRKICPDCKEEVRDIPKQALAMIRRELHGMHPKVFERIGIKSLDELDKIRAFKGKGCSRCKGSGMKGRIAIFEMIEVNEKISKMIGDNTREEEIEKEAKEDGYTTMKQDGIIKILEGLTTIEEVQRVTEDDSVDEVIGAKGE